MGQAGQKVARYEPTSGQWRESGVCPAAAYRTYAVYVDEQDMVWLSDFGGDTLVLVRSRHASASSASAFPREAANVRQILGRPGEVWLPESGTEHITVIRTG